MLKNKFSKLEIEVMQEGIARKIKELQAESKKEYPEVVIEAITEHLLRLQINYSELSKMQGK